ncbi:MAG TPA: hypothetical protein EYQ14_22445 [Gammaproteobacteria bacterium]|nr:hypothetical protein [Gammaproteobacteria bacterium]
MQRMLFSLILILMVPGCMTFTLEGDLPKTPDSKKESETIHGSLYGIEWSHWDVEKCDNKKGIVRVSSHTNAVYLLASVASLGLYVPQNVTWWCDGTKAADDDGDAYRPED